MFAELDRELTPWHVVGALLVALALGSFLGFVSLPRLSEYTGGIDVFDPRMAGYTHDDAVAILQALGADGKAYYRGTHLLLDVFFPPAWFLATVFVFLWFTRPGARFAVPLQEDLRLIVVIVALFGLLLDWGENAVVFTMLMGDGEPSTSLVGLGSLFTYLKSIAYIVAAAAVVVTVILAVIRGLASRSAAAQS